MSKPSHLIPNLSEMMEAYTEVEEGTVQETQSGEKKAKERAEYKGELKRLEEESRKMKKVTKESEAEKRDEKVKSLISDKAATLMEKSMKDGGFIVERGFKRLISPFSILRVDRKQGMAYVL